MKDQLVLCDNALKETRGKELEALIDYDMNQRCGFLHGCIKVFGTSVVDKLRSHVANYDINHFCGFL